MIERSGSGSIPLTNGYGSRRPKNYRNFVFHAVIVNIQVICRLDDLISVRGAGGENDRGHDGDEQRAEDCCGEVHRPSQGSREHRQHTQVHTQPDPQGPHVLGHPDPDPLIRGTDPDPDPSLFS